jgi:hypothetical protein
MMNALSVAHTVSHALPALSPWIIPVIAVAAKGAWTRQSLRGGAKPDGPTDRQETRAEKTRTSLAERPRPRGLLRKW